MVSFQMYNLSKPNSILLETNRFDKDNYRSLAFIDPARVISCYKEKDVQKTLLELEEYINKGYYAAGYISYEAGFAFEDALKGLDKGSTFPLLWFGIYKKPVILQDKNMDLSKSKRLPYKISNLRLNSSHKKYIDNVKKIKNFIRRGDTYQVNYTFKYKFDFRGSAQGLYQDLREKQSVSYSAFINTGDSSILSLSPELFFRKDKSLIEVRPMKGTFDRGINIEQDRRNMKALEQSLKNRSENVMIVDLLRNDLGRVSMPGTVRTRKLFEVERYETLFQMISIVKARLKKDVGLCDLFKAIFPSGSVTGAPKISTMKIISLLEKEPRNIYTGSIGFFEPDGKAVFNVAIRTVLIDNKTRKAEMGVGSGIVIDSDPEKEFEECKLKTNFLTQAKKDFKLIETMLWQPQKGYFLLRHHLKRLFSSADYFDFKYDKNRVEKELKRLEKSLKDNYQYRIRVLLARGGELESSFSRLDRGAEIEKVRFSEKKTSSSSVFFYHKTTIRDLYDKELKKWRRQGYFDIMFTNEKNQITEGAISNIIIKKGRFYYTPPLSCGLLDGVYRRYLLDSRKIPLKEKILYKKDIKNADEIYMINSVRGMVKAVL
ncbi:MAG: aminodeoxychorismate synthase component I [Candidatus Omnitrophica bacterium]|nr:aminodeoxychorismate synthase component I [Candidatus Omnitrophota bacterium]MBU4149444.1 aminodeoxychorismate synthase component I [Candidatus Omnitrophota bacterium]